MTTREPLQDMAEEEAAGVPIDKAVVTALWRGGISGALLLGLLFLAVGYPTVEFFIMLCAPFLLLQFFPMVLAGKWFARDLRRVFALVVATGVAAVAWLLFVYSGGEQTDAHRIVMTYMLGGQALMAGCQMWLLRRLSSGRAA